MHSFLTSALDRGEWSPSRPSRFNPGKIPGPTEQEAGCGVETFGIRTPYGPARGLFATPTELTRLRKPFIELNFEL
jgi:hypothetical protein